jgi:hypothetical protein
MRAIAKSFDRAGILVRSGALGDSTSLSVRTEMLLDPHRSFTVLVGGGARYASLASGRFS